MGKHAVAIRRDNGSLGLFLRIVRAPSGIYVIWAAGQERQGHNPHTSWHHDGRFHSKSFGEMFTRWRQRQQLDAFAGVEPFITTSLTRLDPPGLPDCDARQFDSVMEVAGHILSPPPNGTQVDVQLAAAGAVPAPPVFNSPVLQQRVIEDGAPAIVVSIYNVQWDRL